MDDNLIFDMGCHKGEDTAYYLRRGFRVVAVEADPALCVCLQTRFAREIAAGEVTLVCKAIAETAGTAAFFSNTSNSVWGTISPEWARRNAMFGAPSSTITVETITFASLIEKYGVPYYLKIDIEGADILCLEGLLSFTDRPSFISIESEKRSWADLKREFDLFQQLGYHRFQLVDQRRVPEQSVTSLPDHVFEFGSSGAFGDDLPGPWVEHKKAIGAYRWIFLHYWLTGDYGVLRNIPYVNRIANRYRPSWYDTHAAYSPPLA